MSAERWASRSTRSSKGYSLSRKRPCHPFSTTFEKTPLRRAMRSCNSTASCVRLPGRFADLFAKGMHQSVRHEKDRLALMLDAAETSGGSLDLDVILSSIARGLARALNLSHCAVYLRNKNDESFVPRGSIEGVERPDLIRLLGRPFKETELLASKALASGALTAFCGDEAPAVFGDPPDVAEIKTVVSIPIALAGEGTGARRGHLARP